MYEIKRVSQLKREGKRERVNRERDRSIHASETAQPKQGDLASVRNTMQPPQDEIAPQGTTQQVAKRIYAIRREVLTVDIDPAQVTPKVTKSIKSMWEGFLSTLKAADNSCKEALVRDLDDEELFGRRRIYICMRITAGPEEAKTLVEFVLPFLLVVSHPDFINCQASYSAVNGIYKFISGDMGTRAITFLERLLLHLLHLQLHTTIPLIAETLSAAAIVLGEVVHHDPAVIFNERLPDLVSNFEYFAELEPATTSHVNAIMAEMRGRGICKVTGQISRDEDGDQGRRANVVRECGHVLISGKWLFWNNGEPVCSPLHKCIFRIYFEEVCS